MIILIAAVVLLLVVVSWDWIASKKYGLLLRLSVGSTDWIGLDWISIDWIFRLV